MQNTETTIDAEVQGTTFAELWDAYPAPVRQLMTWGELGLFNQAWANYPAELGLAEEHIPDLVRMALDTRFDLKASDWENDFPYWAPNHALRTLGQLKVCHVASQLFPLLDKEDDFLVVDLPKVFAQMGLAILPKLIAYFQDPTQTQRTRERAADCLAEMGKQHPETRTLVLEALLAVFQQYQTQDPAFNTMLLYALLEIKAVEAADLIQAAFEAGCLDTIFCGDWLDIKPQLGLELTESERLDLTQRKQAFQARLARECHQSFQEMAEARNRQLGNQQAKHKRKLAKVARKQNRKK